MHNRLGAAACVADPQKVRRLLAQVALHYRTALLESGPVLDYLRSRGVGYATAQRFEVGHARPLRQDLQGPLAGATPAEVAASGLVEPSPVPGGAGHDRFRDRLMFPVRDSHGEVVGFGGRLMREVAHAPKYLNSPEGPVFRKRELFYGLWEALPAVRAQRRAVVMEGYVDVLVAHQAGVDTAVGSLGTAVTSWQLQSLLRYADEVVFCFDGDEAGQRAAERALFQVAQAMGQGRVMRFAMLPEGHDPASLVQSSGPDALHRALGSALDAQRFATIWAGQGCDLSIAEGRARCFARLGRLWHAVPPSAARDGLSEWVASMLGIGTGEVQRLWRATAGVG